MVILIDINELFLVVWLIKKRLKKKKAEVVECNLTNLLFGVGYNSNLNWGVIEISFWPIDLEGFVFLFGVLGGVEKGGYDDSCMILACVQLLN